MISNVIGRKFYHYLTGNIHVVERSLHDKYGPIVRTGPNCLSFCSQEAFESIYGFNHGFEKGDFYAFARNPATGTSNVFSARAHAEHRERRRKVAGAALTSAHVRAYSPTVVKHVQFFLSNVASATTEAKDGVINIAEPVHALTFNTMVELIYGPSVTPFAQPWTETVAGKSILPVMRAISKFGWGASQIPLLGHLMSTNLMSKLTRKPTFDSAGNFTGLSALYAKAQELVIKKPDLVLGVEQPSIAKSMLSIDQGDSRHMEPRRVLSECTNLLFAGPGSTAAAVTGVLEQLGTVEGQKWQEMVRNELKQNKASSSSSSSDEQSSRVLDAVVKESMRYSAPFPTAFPRDVMPGAENSIPGTKQPLPIGTLVGVNLWTISRDQAVWGDDARHWNPQRWLDAPNEAAKKKALEEKFAVFGKGARGCIGKEVAFMIVTQAVASLLRTWRVERVGGVRQKAWLEMQNEFCGLRMTKLELEQ